MTGQEPYTGIQEHETKGGYPMKTRSPIISLAALLGTSQAAYATSTNTIYSSGYLVLIFFGICALVVLFQLIPAILMLIGMVKAMVTGKTRETVRQLK